MNKKCVKCKKDKEINEFHIKDSKTGLKDSRCKSCVKKYKAELYIKNPSKWMLRQKKYRAENPTKYQETLKRSNNRKYIHRYGITLEQKLKMLNQQNGLCNICQTDIATRSCVDHDHKTGIVRSLLCDNCNTGIGMFKENPELLLKTIEYLNFHKNLPLDKGSKI